MNAKIHAAASGDRYRGVERLRYISTQARYMPKETVNAKTTARNVLFPSLETRQL